MRPLVRSDQTTIHTKFAEPLYCRDTTATHAMTIRSEARLQQSLDEVTRLLHKHRGLETLAHRQEGPKRDLLESLQHRQNLAELGKRVSAMHGADLAFVLESLPPEDRRLV